MEKVFNEIYGEYVALLEKMKKYSFDETAYFMEIAGQIFEKEAFCHKSCFTLTEPQSNNVTDTIKKPPKIRWFFCLRKRKTTGKRVLKKP